MRSSSVRGIVLIIAMLLPACAGATPTAPTPARGASPDIFSDPGAGLAAPTPAGGSERVTITFAVREEERPVFEPLARRFEHDHPDIHVQLVNVETVARTIVTPDGTFSHDEDSIQETLGIADTAALGVTAEAIASGWVRDLRPFMDADPSFERADFYSAALAEAHQSGQIYVLPHTLWIELLAYNKALWEIRGLPAPRPDWRWADLLAAAEQLAEKHGAQVEVYGMADWEIWSSVLRRDLAAAGVDPAALARLDEPEVITALEHIAALAETGAIYVPQGGRGDLPALQALIRNQQVGIWPADMLEDMPAAFEVGTLPAPSASVGVDGYIMSAGTQHPQQAWRWLSFLSREVVGRSSRGVSSMGRVPARKSVAQQSGYWEQLDPQATLAISAVLERGPGATLPDFGLRRALLLEPAVVAVVHDGRPASAALHDAQAALEQQLAQQPQPSPAAGPITVATPAPVAAEGATVITFGAPRSSVIQVRQAADAFNGRNLGIFVAVENSDGPDGPASLSALAAETDCFVAAGPPSQGEYQALLDLRPLIDADRSFDLADYPATLLAPFQQSGRLHGLPYAVEFRVLNYNPLAFDRALVAYPTAAWSLDDFRAAAQQLTRGAGAARHYGFASTAWPAQDVFFFLDRIGVAATTGSGDTRAPHFIDPSVADAIRLYLDVLRTASPHTRLRGYARDSAVDDDALQLVSAGRVAMWFDFGADIRGLGPGSYQGFVPAIAPPPLAGRGVTANDFLVRGLYISARTQRPDACWTWIKELSGDLSGLTGAFPARRSLAESDAFLSQAPRGAQDVYQAYRAAFERTPGTGGAAEGDQGQLDYYWLLRAIDRALEGEDLERELAEAQRVTEQYMSCVQAGGAGTVCATQVDPDYQGPQGDGS